METLEKKLEKLELSEVEKGIYCLSVGNLIKSYVVVDLNKLECSLNYDNYKNIYRSFYKIKSKEKAINLMLKVRKNFISCHNNSCLSLQTNLKPNLLM